MASKKYLGSLYATLGIDTDDWDKSLARVDRNLRSMGNQFEQFGIRATAMVSVPLGAFFKNSLDKFAEFNTAFAGIKKTVETPKGIDSESFFGSLEREIRDLSKTMPQSAAQLSLIGEMAGQLGVKSQDLVPFIKTMAQLGDTTNLSSDQAAIAMAKFTNIIGYPRDEVQKLGDSLVALGNSTATFESDILMMSTDMASAGKNAGLAGQEIFALAATMSSLGENAEAGSTSMSKLLRNLQDTTITGGERLQALNKIVGEDFKKAWETDAGGALVKFAQGLEMVREKHKTLTPTMEKLGIDNALQIRSIEKLASGHGLLAEAMKKTNDEFGNGALAEEALKRYATFDSQMSMLKNQIDDVAIGIGAKLAPQMLFLTKVVAGLASAFDALPGFLQNFVIYFGELAVIAPVVALGFGLVTKAVGLMGLASVGAAALALAKWAAVITMIGFVAENWRALVDVVVGIGETIGAAVVLTALKFMDTIGSLVGNGFALIGRGIDALKERFPILEKAFVSLGSSAEATIRKSFDLDKPNKGINDMTAIMQAGAVKMTDGFNKLGESSSKAWASMKSGASKAADDFKKWNSQYDPAADGEKKLTKAQKERLKVLEKINEQAKKATEYLDDQLESIEGKIKEANIQKSVEEAFKNGNTQALDQWKKDLETATREGIEKSFLDKGGQFPATKEDAEKIGKLATAEANATWETWKEKFTKQGETGLMGKFPDYLSKTITDSILNGFEEGFSSDAIKGFGQSISSIFAQEFQDSFKGLFKPGGFTADGLMGSFSNLAIAYGSQTLFSNLSDNERDTQGGIVSGAILGAGAGATIGSAIPGIGTIIGAAIGTVIGAGGGYIAGSIGPSTNTDTQNRHDTATFIEELLKSKGGLISFLQDGYNIQEGGPNRFNTSASGGFLEDIGQFYVNGLSGNNPVGNATFGTVDGIDSMTHATPTEPGVIQGPGWADQYWAQFGQSAGESFGALGAAFSEMAGTMGPQMEQMGVLIAENLGGNLDNARVLLQTLDISAEDLATSFLNIGLSGQESWHQVEIYMQRIPELTGEGLVAFADLAGGMERFRQSAGTGKQSLIDLKNIMAEAREAGVKDFGELRTAMINQGIAVEDVDRFIQAMGQRGITTMEQFANASDRDLGGVVADMESLGFQWENVGDGIEGADKNLDSLSKKLEKLESKEVDVKININYDEQNKPKILDGNSSFDFSSGGSSSSSVQKKSLVNLPTLDETASSHSVVVNVDARGSEAGVERKITAAIMASQKQIIQGSVSAIQQMRRRGAF